MTEPEATKKTHHKSPRRSKKSSLKSRKEGSLSQSVTEDNPLWLVIIPVGEDHQVSKCTTFQSLVEKVADYLGSDVSILVFQGRRHNITKGGFNYLVTDGGEALPLFVVPSADELEIAEDGNLSEDWEEDIKPDYKKEDAASESAANGFFEEDDSMLGSDDPYADEPDFGVHDPDED